MPTACCVRYRTSLACRNSFSLRFYFSALSMRWRLSIGISLRGRCVPRHFHDIAGKLMMSRILFACWNAARRLVNRPDRSTASRNVAEEHVCHKEGGHIVKLFYYSYRPRILKFYGALCYQGALTLNRHFAYSISYTVRRGYTNPRVRERDVAALNLHARISPSVASFYK